jgi:hypothetical protein
LRSFAEAVLPYATPLPVSTDLNILLGALVESIPHDRVANFAAGEPTNDASVERHRGLLVKQIRADLDTFAAEMSHRIALHLSHLGLLKRFQARCQAYDATELRTLVEKTEASNVEKVLTKRAALFLFDQGLNPLFDVQLAKYKPDLFDTSLYVEAKWYGKNPKRKLTKAPWQIWEAWNDLNALHEVREAFFLIFRTGGPLVKADDVRHAGISIFPIVVDIARPEESGHGSKEQPVYLDASILLPRGAPEVAEGIPE